MIDTIKKILKLSPIPLTKNHLYDMQTRKVIAQLKPDSNCIDVGCYKGEIMDLILKAAPKGQHFGVEPIPVQYKGLVSKYAQQPNVSILNYAASNVSGESTFNYVVSNPSYSGLKKRDYDKPNEEDTTIKVKTELLDTLIPKDINIDLIKIDVEGAELLVLEGAAELVNRCKPMVVFEHGLGASNHYGATPEKVFGYFQEKGMKISNLGSYLKNGTSLSQAEFEGQYHEQKHYYFIAHS